MQPKSELEKYGGFGYIMLFTGRPGPAAGFIEPAQERNVSDDPSAPLYEVSRHHIRDVWQAVERGDIEDLDPEDAVLGRILQSHSEVYGNDFTAADSPRPVDGAASDGVNPFLHVSVHLAVERQLEQGQPGEVVRFYNAMRSRQASHHDAVHLIGTMLSALMFDVIHGRGAFDTPGYRDLLRKCTPLAPDDVLEAIDAAFGDD